jgi:hypothetical protein
MNQVAQVRMTIAEVLRLGHFYAAPGFQLDLEHVEAEESPWEIFRGRLVARHLSGATATFESWNIFITHQGQRSGEPLVAFKLDPERGLLQVVRGLWCYTWEGYHGGDNVYLSREVPRWLRELVGSIDLATCGADVDRTALAQWIFRAVVGLSRLPLSSVDAPLPDFALGHVAYFFNPDLTGTGQQPLASWRDLLSHECKTWPPAMRTKWLEFLLRATPADEVAELAEVCVQRWSSPTRGTDVPRLLRAVFNDISLSPYTAFVDKALACLRHLVRLKFLTAAQQVDFLSCLLRQLARHLTAYDLITFHHRGANYPDALLLDAALTEYLALVESHPGLFEGTEQSVRLRRRALRLAWLHRRRYEEYPVPDAPTSPGENARVLSPLYERVPEEQILNLGKRKKRLYHNDPLPGHVGSHGLQVLQQCGRDLERAEEMRELGMALFIERPFAALRAPGEPDLSPLLAHEGFSRTQAEVALQALAREPLLGLSAEDVSRCRQVLADPWPAYGIAAKKLTTALPRVVSLADAAKAAQDFVILRTLPGSVRAFCADRAVAALLQARGLAPEAPEQIALIVATAINGKPGILLLDAEGQRLLEFES